LGQPNIENQQRHRDGEDPITERIETDFCEHDDFPPNTSSLFVPWGAGNVAKFTALRTGPDSAQGIGQGIAQGAQATGSRRRYLTGK
jgi:hypothetical protein